MARLGLDMFSLRSQAWTPFEQIDFAARWGVEVVHYSEPRFIGGLAPDHLRRVRSHAARRGIAIEIGMLSICPSSGIFNPTQGTASDQIVRMIGAALLVGSPFIRCVVGTLDDRRAPGGIDERIEDTLRVLKDVRTRVEGAGLKLAIENHAGDLQARELKDLIRTAGADWVGACIDAGNAVWAIEDPHLTLETLAPHVLTSHIRDSVVWDVPEGAAVAWTRMGEGSVRIDEYVRSFLQKCPGRTLSLEIIVLPARTMAYRDPAFWGAYRTTPAWEFLRFQALAAAGRPAPGETAGDPIAREREDVEISLRWTKALVSARPHAAAE